MSMRVEYHNFTTVKLSTIPVAVVLYGSGFPAHGIVRDIPQTKGNVMMIGRIILCFACALTVCGASSVFAQEKKLERIRTGGGSASAAQMSDRKSTRLNSSHSQISYA